ncbi:TVP38/TMEM64 family protein [Calidifontibacillus erzurumensis]|uniref:TVP38/TMEM64 family protein n=1 Tax=Calidifontibacillus erzurumensis TaxID=2741433 RepID=UPI0035B51DCD
MEQFLHSLITIKSSYSTLLQFTIMVAVSCVPFAPIPVLATIIGANHSIMMGLIINLGGTVVGSIIQYLVSRNLLQKFANKILLKYRSYGRFISLIQTNGFLAVFIGRLIPILPSAGVSLIAGICGVTFLSFTTATILGKFPIILAFSLAGHQLAEENWRTVILASLYVLVIFLIGRKIKKKWHS